jgi:hypothetical protein
MGGVAVVRNKGLLFGIARTTVASTQHACSEDRYKSLGEQEIKRFRFRDLS